MSGFVVSCLCELENGKIKIVSLPHSLMLKKTCDNCKTNKPCAYYNCLELCSDCYLKIKYPHRKRIRKIGRPSAINIIP